MLVCAFFGAQHISDVLHGRTDVVDRWAESSDLLFQAIRAQGELDGGGGVRVPAVHAGSAARRREAMTTRPPMTARLIRTTANTVAPSVSPMASLR